jgi:hypothetical protein
MSDSARHPTVPEGIRTPDPRLRRPLLYPAELQTQKQVMGIEPTYPAWKAGVLPLNYTCANSGITARFRTLQDRYEITRGDKIRTCGLLLPKQAL